MQENLKAKYEITDEDLKQAQDELCVRGIAKGCFQNTNALLALLELLATGDIKAPQ